MELVQYIYIIVLPSTKKSYSSSLWLYRVLDYSVDYLNF